MDALSLSHASFVAISIITVCTLAALACHAERAWAYIVESSHLAVCRRRLQALAVADPHVELGVPSGSLVGRWFRNARQQAASHLPVRVPDLIEEARDRDEGTFSHHVANFMVSVLLILGLAGTLVSFRDVLALDNPIGSTAHGAIDPSKLQRYSQSVVSGMGGAFLASLAGIMGTVIVFLTRCTVRAWRERLLNALADVTRDELLRLMPAPVLSQAGAFLDASARLSEFTASLGQISCRLEDVATAAGNNQRGSCEQLNEFAQRLDAAAGSFSVAFSEDNVMARSLERFRQEVSAHVESTKAEREERHSGQEVLARTVETISQGIHASLQSQQEMRSTVLHLEGAMRQNQETAASVLHHWSQLADRMELVRQSSEARMTTAIESVHGHIKDIQQALRPLQDLAGHLRPVRDMAERMESSQAKAGQEQRKALDSIRSIIDSHRTASGLQHGEWLENLSALRDGLASLKQLPQVLGSVQAALQRQQDGEARREREHLLAMTSLHARERRGHPGARSEEEGGEVKPTRANAWARWFLKLLGRQI